MSLKYSISPAIQELERAYQFFNQQLFNSVLDEKIIITIQTRGRRTNALAWYWQQRWKNLENSIAELNISAETIKNHDPYESLIHEMVHHYCAIKKIQDCSRNGFYHNKQFKQAAENAGLICEKHDRIGWGVTKLGEKAEEEKKKVKPKKEVFSCFIGGILVKKKKKNSMKKRKCDCICFWAEASYVMEVKCLRCDKIFES